MTRDTFTIYGLMHGPGGWLVKLAEGWQLCGVAPEPIRSWAILMFKWDLPARRVAYRDIREYDHR